MCSEINIGKKIASRRTELNISQTDLAIKVNVSPPTISQYESNKRKPSFEVMPRLADALEVPCGFFFEDVDTQKIPSWYKTYKDYTRVLAESVMLIEELEQAQLKINALLDDVIIAEKKAEASHQESLSFELRLIKAEDKLKRYEEALKLIYEKGIDKYCIVTAKEALAGESDAS